MFSTDYSMRPDDLVRWWEDRGFESTLVPDTPISPPTGCHFHPRCPLYRDNPEPYLRENCPTHYPEAFDQGGGHWARCHAASPKG